MTDLSCFKEQNNFEFTPSPLVLDALSTAYEYCDANPEEFRSQASA
jgi:hypothetical protein